MTQIIRPEIISFLIIALIFSGCHNRFRICEIDQWKSRNGTVIKYDKIEHFIGCGFLYILFRIIGFDVFESVVLVIMAGVIWEIKDGIIPYEKYGWIGGEGFSRKDLMADILILPVAVFIDLIF